jgi:hypothetical protein
VAQSYAEMEKLRGEYLEEMKRKGIAEEYPKYLELPHDLWAEAEGRQNASMVDGVSGNIGCQKSSSKTS